jgi:hypothetical protein
MVRKTKRVKKGGMTIPQLRRAFEHIEGYAKKNNVEAFRKEWKKTFGKNISESAAKDYLTFVKSQAHQSGGGAPLTGAPLDYTTRAGSDPSTAANVPPYVQGGFGFANMDSFRLMSGKEDITPRIPAGLGSNAVTSGGGKTRKLKRKAMKGGAFPSLGTAIAEAMQRPLTMNSPPHVGNDLVMMSKGHTGELTSPRPEINNLDFTVKPGVYSANTTNELRTF